MRGLEELMTRMEGVTSVDVLSDLFLNLISDLGYAGFDAFSLKSGTIDNADQDCNFFVHGYGTNLRAKGFDLIAKYVDDGWLQMDPVMAEISRVSTPFEYIEFLHNAKRNSSVRWQLGVMKLLSVHRAWLIPLNTVGYLRGMTVYTRGNKDGARQRFLDTQDEVHLMCIKFMHNCVNLHTAAVPKQAQMDVQRVDVSSITRREIDCLHWAARGKTNREIGAILNISDNTVRYHMKNAFKKLNAQTRARAVSAAINEGLIQL
jgi:DNA-binding CsgD family transcriptional regulator